MKALITGRRGSCAHYLTEYLQSRGDEVHAWGERPHEDMQELPGLMAALECVRPDVVFHLASIANVRMSFEQPAHVIGNNTLITVRLFEALDRLKLKPVVVLGSTSEVYGNSIHSPICEEWPFAPINPYAVSKCNQEHIASMYATILGVPLVITRAFGYVNPRRPDLALTSWARQIVEIEAERREELHHGPLTSIRTFCDVRDIVRGYAMAADLREGVYNIGSEEALSMGEMLDRLEDQSPRFIPLKLNAGLVRRQDIERQIPNCSRFRQATGWEPVIPLADSLRWLMTDARLAVERSLQIA